MLQTKRFLVFAVFLFSLFTSSCEGKAYGNETCPENELSIYLNSHEETMTELLSIFQLNFLQGSVAKRPETIIAMLSIYVDFEYVQTPECALVSLRL